MNSQWPLFPFEEVVSSRGSGAQGLAQKDWSNSGAFPVIGQGANEIEGWTDREDLLLHPEPAYVLYGGHTCRAKFVDQPFVPGPNVKILTPKNSLRGKFLYYFLSQLPIQSQGYADHFPQVRRCSVPVPALAEQDRLVALLDEADALRKLRVQAEARTAQLIPAIFQEMFGEGANLPTKTVGEISSFITSGSRGWAKYYAAEGAAFVRVQNLTGHRLSMDDIAFVQPPPSAETERTRVNLNDVLLAITGNTIGLCAHVDSIIGEAYVNQHVAIIRPTNEVVPEYLQLFLSMPSGGQQQITEKQAGQTKPGLTLGQVKALKVPVPSIDAQFNLAARVSEVRALQAAQGAARGKVEALWGSLLVEVFG